MANKAIDELWAMSVSLPDLLQISQSGTERFVNVAFVEQIITAREQRLGELERAEHYLTLILGNRHDHDPAECGVICKINAIEGVIEQQEQRIAELEAQIQELQNKDNFIRRTNLERIGWQEESK